MTSLANHQPMPQPPSYCACGQTLWAAAEVAAKQCSACAYQRLYLRLPEPRRVSLERA